MSYYVIDNEGVAGNFVSGGASFVTANLPDAGETARFLIVNDTDASVRLTLTRTYTVGADNLTFTYDDTVPAKGYDFFSMAIPTGATNVQAGVGTTIRTTHGTSAQNSERVYIYRAEAI